LPLFEEEQPRITRIERIEWVLIRAIGGYFSDDVTRNTDASAVAQRRWGSAARRENLV
jgi:hypothetical protein